VRREETGVKVLLTGAGGFIGSHVARALIERGDEVIALLRPTTPRARIAGLDGRMRIVAIALDDIQQLDALLAQYQPHATMHLAWHAQPSDYLVSPANLTSLAASATFIERVIASGCRKVIGVGTCLEYAASETLRRESDPTDPISLYASCKLAAWLVARALGVQHDAEVVWARLFHVHGPGEDPTRLIPAVTRSLAAGTPFDLSPGLQVRDHLHVADVAAAIVKLAEPGIAGIVNVCAGVPVTLRDVLLTVADILGRRELLRFGARPYHPGEVMFLAGDSARLRSTGWAPRFTDLRTSLLDVIAEHRSRPGC
jgi:nucleoside-diphosphate-sugar epimerase